MVNHGQSWLDLALWQKLSPYKNHGQSWTIMFNHGWWWSNMLYRIKHGQPWSIMVKIVSTLCCDKNCLDMKICQGFHHRMLYWDKYCLDIKINHSQPWLMKFNHSVTGLFGHITPIIQINTFRAHQTLILLLHSLDKSSHSMPSFLRVSWPEYILKWFLEGPTQPWLGKNCRALRPIQACSTKHLRPLWPTLGEIERNVHRVLGIFLHSKPF